MKKPVYIRCPRCELNYINKKDKYCEVCKKEMKATQPVEKANDEELELEVCPVCKANYLHGDEEICANCLKEKALEDGHDVEDENEWNSYMNEDAILDNEELGEMASITEIDENGKQIDIDEEDDEEEENDKIEDDLEDDFDDYDFDDDDFEDDEEDDFDDDDED